MIRITLYMKSGNVLILERIKKWKINKNTVGGITSFDWTTDEIGKGKLEFLDLSQIEGFYSEEYELA